MKIIIWIIAAISILSLGCGKQEAEKTRTTGTVTPAPTAVTEDSIKPANPSTLATLMTDMSSAYTEMGQKVEAGNFKIALEAWETMVANAKAIGNFKVDKLGENFIKDQTNLLASLGEIGKMIASQDPGTTEKIAAVNQICNTCHGEYRK